MFAIILGVAIALIFIAYDASTVVTTSNPDKIVELTGSTPDVPNNKAKLALRMLTFRIVQYIIIAVVGIVVVFIVQRFLPKRR